MSKFSGKLTRARAWTLVPTSALVRFFSHALRGKSTHLSPPPHVYSILQRNIKRNDAAIRAFQFGLFDEHSSATLHMSLAGNLGNSNLILENVDGDSAPIQVAIRQGDEFVSQHTIEDVDFIKIDTEGHEAHVLLGLQETIQKNTPLICMEWNTATIKDDFEKYGLFETLFADYACFAVA